MISFGNKPLNESTQDGDFTLEEYRKLLKLAVKNYDVASYSDSCWSERSILWRHDVDFSLDHALVLAKIETQEGVKATYFVNQHSEFYNLAEKRKLAILSEILSIGHDLGLHLDSAFYESSEHDISTIVRTEADYLESLCGVRPVAFSFHNPTAQDLTREAEEYGGLVNCYSKNFKTAANYCSDSNGYWRYRRLFDVLSDAPVGCLQVLTHPGWWHESPLPPRSRILRVVYGRAEETIEDYDTEKVLNGRQNHAGADELNVLGFLPAEQNRLCDYLLCREQFGSLALELWKVHSVQTKRLAAIYCKVIWSVPGEEVDNLIAAKRQPNDGVLMLDTILDGGWSEVSGVSLLKYRSLSDFMVDLLYGNHFCNKTDLMDYCLQLCRLISNALYWGESQVFANKGLVELTDELLADLLLRRYGCNKNLGASETNLDSSKWSDFKLKHSEAKK